MRSAARGERARGGEHPRERRVGRQEGEVVRGTDEGSGERESEATHDGTAAGRAELTRPGEDPGGG